MKKLYSIILTAISASFLAGCATVIPNENILAKYDCDIIFDVRTEDEYDEIHLQDAILLPVDNIVEEIDFYGVEKDEKIGVYCRRGVRAELAKVKLEAAGYKNVTNLGSIRRLERLSGTKTRLSDRVNSSEKVKRTEKNTPKRKIKLDESTDTNQPQGFSIF